MVDCRSQPNVGSGKSPTRREMAMRNAMLGSGRIKPRHADDPAMAEHQPYRYGIGGRIRVERSDLQITLRRCQCHHRYQLERVFVLWHQTDAIWQQKRVAAAAKQLACRS